MLPSQTSIRRPPGAALLSAVALAGASCAAAAAPLEGGGTFAEFVGAVPDRVMESAVDCGAAFEGSRAAGADCLSGEFGGFLVGAAAQLAERRGRALFGSRFQVVHRLSWSPFGEGLSGDLDAVIPMAFLAGGETAAGGRESRALFLQQGVTRWRDGEGFRRNDARLGAAWRFSLPDSLGGDVLGVQAVMQENLEHGHRRFVAGVDYMGRWGAGSLQRFVPATGWRPGRPGYEERPLGGSRLGLRLAATTTLSLDAALVRWDEDGPGRPPADGRVAFDWRPHPWLSLGAGVAGIGGADGSSAVRLAVRVPFGGGGGKLPRWKGLGVAGGADAPANPWAPIENVGRLETVERAVAAPSAAAARAGDVSVRFLDAEMITGDEIWVEASIPEPLSEDLRLEARLAPGEGENPAVAGEDFVDLPVEIVIPRGDISARASFQLLRNPRIEADRTLSIDIAVAA